MISETTKSLVTNGYIWYKPSGRNGEMSRHYVCGPTNRRAVQEDRTFGQLNSVNCLVGRLSHNTEGVSFIRINNLFFNSLKTIRHTKNSSQSSL